MAGCHIRAPLASVSRPQHGRASKFKNQTRSKLNNASHFVELQDLRAGLLPSLYYPMVSTMRFFRDNVLLFLSLMRNAQPYPGNHKRSHFR